MINLSTTSPIPKTYIGVSILFLRVTNFSATPVLVDTVDYYTRHIQFSTFTYLCLLIKIGSSLGVENYAKELIGCVLR